MSNSALAGSQYASVRDAEGSGDQIYYMELEQLPQGIRRTPVLYTRAIPRVPQCKPTLKCHFTAVQCRGLSPQDTPRELGASSLCTSCKERETRILSNLKYNPRSLAGLGFWASFRARELNACSKSSGAPVFNLCGSHFPTHQMRMPLLFSLSI